MTVTETSLAGVKLLEPSVHRDSRGFFVETYHASRYPEFGVEPTFVQDNHSRSTMGTLRGLHLQVSTPQAKLVRVVSGTIFDVAVDVRVGSPTFGRWVSATLSSENFLQLFIPEGFAHGFAVLSDIADVEYKCSAFYTRPSTIEDIVTYTAVRLLDQFDIHVDAPRWHGDMGIEARSDAAT